MRTNKGLNVLLYFTGTIFFRALLPCYLNSLINIFLDAATKNVFEKLGIWKVLHSENFAEMEGIRQVDCNCVSMTKFIGMASNENDQIINLCKNVAKSEIKSGVVFDLNMNVLHYFSL